MRSSSADVHYVHKHNHTLVLHASEVTELGPKVIVEQ